jgi:hypothetical protein
MEQTMSVILVPQSAGQEWARLWIGITEAAAPPESFAVAVAGRGAIPVSPTRWRPVLIDGAMSAGESRAYVQTVEIGGLQPNTRYLITAGGTTARLATLPRTLPNETEPPFTILVSSCFYRGHSKNQLIGRAMRSLGEVEKPHAKFLCGDQVYLDHPPFVDIPLPARLLARRYLAKYLENWSDTGGFQAFLAEGATYFTADDHEFWNNYPNFATVDPRTYFGPVRDRIGMVSRGLFGLFQCEQPSDAGKNRQFQVGEVSFFVADTRINRAPGQTRYMTSKDHAELERWLRGLPGPGVLVIGQPILEKPMGRFGRTFGDRALPNYEQYGGLVAALYNAPHSVLVLTGDVHYARIARTEWLGKTQVAEVIASPSALVFGDHAEPEDHQVTEFPPKENNGGKPAARVLERWGGTLTGDNFVLVQFTRASSGVKVRIRHWYLRKGGGVPAPRPTEFTLT